MVFGSYIQCGNECIVSALLMSPGGSVPHALRATGCGRPGRPQMIGAGRSSHPVGGNPYRPVHPGVPGLEARLHQPAEMAVPDGTRPVPHGPNPFRTSRHLQTPSDSRHQVRLKNRYQSKDT